MNREKPVGFTNEAATERCCERGGEREEGTHMCSFLFKWHFIHLRWTVLTVREYEWASVCMSVNLFCFFFIIFIFYFSSFYRFFLCVFESLTRLVPFTEWVCGTCVYNKVMRHNNTINLSGHERTQREYWDCLASMKVDCWPKPCSRWNLINTCTVAHNIKVFYRIRITAIK